jgi:hypothetical protein
MSPVDVVFSKLAAQVVAPDIGTGKPLSFKKNSPKHQKVSGLFVKL